MNLEKLAGKHGSGPDKKKGVWEWRDFYKI